MPENNHPVDVVQVASRFADGTPDQTPGFKFIDEEVGKDATEQQMKQQAASNADQMVRYGELEGGATGDLGVYADDPNALDPLAEQRESIILGAFEDASGSGEAEVTEVGTTPVEPVVLDTPEGTNYDEGTDEDDDEGNA